MMKSRDSVERLFVFLMGIGAVLLVFATTAYAQNEDNTQVDNQAVDLVFVLDNSGSMIHHDPQFITRDIVTNFLINIKEDFRVGMVIFDRNAKLTEPLTNIATTVEAEHFLNSLEMINYQGQFTNTPAAIERAIYELKSNGRGNAKKVIVLLTDGIVDTGNKEQDLEGEKWLKENLTRESQKADIRIFGIAFTDKADFRLIQTLAVKTDGDYFRAYTTDDIQEIFKKINSIIIQPPMASTSPESAVIQPETSGKPTTEPAPEVPTEGTFVKVREAYNPAPLLLTGIVIIVIVLVFLIYLRRKRDMVVPSRYDSEIPGASSQDPLKGQAELIDAENVISETGLSIPLEKKIVKIGRDMSNDIVISKDSISSLHATIEYRNGYFYLEDQRSTNGTKLNDERVKENTPMRLKSGDKLHFAIFEFRFLVPDMAPYGETVMIEKNDTEPNLES